MSADWTLIGRCFSGLSLSIALCISAAFAQSAPQPTTASEDTLSLLAPKSLAPINPLLRPSREYRGVALSDWMIYPSLFAGVIADNNLFWTESQRVSAVGSRLNPRLVAERDAGIHKTTLYGDVDARLYPSVPGGDAVDAQAGVAHLWEIQRDLTFKAKAEYDRRAVLLNGGLVSTPTGAVGTLASPLIYNQFQGSAAIQKSFDRLFVGLSADVAKTNYDSLHTTNGTFPQTYRDSLVTTVTGRGGFWFSPIVYAFTEAAGNFRDYSEQSYASRGYRVVTGLGSDRISLFRGEMYGGFQQQIYNTPLSGAAASPVFGGKVYWYPTRAITVRASLDETFSDSSLPTPTNPLGFPARVTSAQINFTYQLAKDWSASWRGAFERSNYLGSVRRDNGWMTGATFNYEIYRNVGVSVDYSFNRVNSNAVGASHSRNAVTLGVTYRY